MARGILGILTGFCCWAFLWWALSAFLPVLFPKMFKQDGMTDDFLLNLLMVLLSVDFAFLAGLLCARLAKIHELMFAFILGLLQLGTAVYLNRLYGPQMPFWFQLSFLVFIGPGVFGGAMYQLAVKNNNESRRIRMEKIILILCAAVLISGCKTTKPKPGDLIRQNYEIINFSDGIDLDEAIIIAQKEVVDQMPPGTYLLEKPLVMTDFESMPYQDHYWFVAFHETGKSRTPVVYMVVLRKDTGKIVFSRNYSPVNEWVLEAVLLKLHEKPPKIDE